MAELLDDLKRLFAENRLKDEAIYAHVLSEIERGYRRDGLWAKALADAKFVEHEAKSRYIKLRVQSIRDEITLLQIDDSRNKSTKSENKVGHDTGTSTSTSYAHARSTYSNEQLRKGAASIPRGGRHTQRPFLCENCQHHGIMFLENTGFLGMKQTIVCPKCGNRGSAIK